MHPAGLNPPKPSFKKVRKALGLEKMQRESAYCLTYCQDQELIYVSSEDGRILQRGRPRRRNLQVSKPRIEYLESVVPIKYYSERVSKLSYLCKVIAENRLPEKAIKVLQRTLLVCFTTHISNLRKLVRKITRLCEPCRETIVKSRNPPVRAKRLQGYPTFTGEKRTYSSIGIQVPLWTWNLNRKLVKDTRL